MPTMIVKGKAKSRTWAMRSRATGWFTSHSAGFVVALLDPPLFLFFLMVLHLFNPQTNPPLFDPTQSWAIIGICLTAASFSSLALTVRPHVTKHGSAGSGLGLNVRTPSLPRRSRSPGILELLAPFLRTSMWESQELAMVMHKSYELMKKHVVFIRTLTWTERYTSRPSNFMMSEAISLILRLLPPVEKHSATCTGCK